MPVRNRGRDYSRPSWRPRQLEAMFEAAVLLDPEERYATKIFRTAHDDDRRTSNGAREASFLIADGLLAPTGEYGSFGRSGPPPRLLEIPSEGAQYALNQIDDRIQELSLVRKALVDQLALQLSDIISQ